MPIEKRDLADNFLRYVVSKTLERKPKVFSLTKIDIRGNGVPSASGCSFLERSVGEIKGQIADWRASLTKRSEGFHAVEYQDRYECHIDKWDPKKNLWRHLSEDSPGTLGLIFGVAAAILGGVSAYYFYEDYQKKKNEKSN